MIFSERYAALLQSKRGPAIGSGSAFGAAGDCGNGCAGDAMHRAAVTIIAFKVTAFNAQQITGAPSLPMCRQGNSFHFFM